LTKKENYLKSDVGKGEKVNIEYVSANPTGTLHIGHGRGAVYGDNLSRIMSFCGYDVTREYYINDAGNQMNNLGISIKERYKEVCGLECNLPEDGYHGKEIIKIAEELYKEHKDSKLSEDIPYFKKAGLDILLDAIKKDLDGFRVNFDVFTSEQSLYDRGYVENVLNEFKKNDNCYVSEDALWLKTSNYGDEKDRVIVKNDGNYT
jgi:arginyl-tRNA synthetase